MNAGEYFNQSAADWAKQNIRGRLEVRRLFSSRAGVILTYTLVFCVPGAFFTVGFVALVLGVRDRFIVGGSFFFGFLLLIPCVLIVLLGAYVRRGFVKSLDAEGVSGSFGQRYSWGKLYYVDHVTKHMRIGWVSHRIKDNQLELVFEGGKLIIPPLIHDRARFWELINRVPVEIRDDGKKRVDATGEEKIKHLMEFLKMPPTSQQQIE